MFRILALVLLCSIGTLAPVEAAESVYGSIKFDANVFDFGSVYRGTDLTHRFTFTNVGAGPLTIQGVHAACGCTAVEVDKGKRYQPGETGFVDVKLDTTDFAGAMVKTVTVLSNERLLPDRTLTLKAFVKTEIEAEPPLVDFGDVSPAAGIAQVVRIKPVSGARFEVKELVFNDQVLTAVLAKEEGGWTVTVRLKETLPPGFVKETILVKNTSTYLKELPIPVRANVKGAIDVAPAYLEFGAIAQAEGAKRSLTMRGAQDFNIVSTRAELIVNGRRIDDASKFLKVDALPHERDKKLVSVELRNAANTAGSVHGKLFIETSDPAQKELAVDFYAFFR